MGTIDVFTTTGWVLTEKLFVRCTEDIAAGSLTTLVLSIAAQVLGTAAEDGSSDARDLDSGEGIGGGVGFTYNLITNFDTEGMAHSTNVILTTDVQITNGTLVIDAWYRPITDDGALAGDDIDITDMDAIADAVWNEVDTEVAAVPAANATWRLKLGWLFALARNKRTQTATTETVLADDGTTTIGTSTKSDDGTTYSRGEFS